MLIIQVSISKLKQLTCSLALLKTKQSKFKGNEERKKDIHSVSRTAFCIRLIMSIKKKKRYFPIHRNCKHQRAKEKEKEKENGNGNRNRKREIGRNVTGIIYILYHKQLKENIIYNGTEIPQACCTSHPFILHKVSSPYKLKSMQ